jgi:hypothetical protein
VFVLSAGGIRVVRRRALGGGMDEEILLANDAGEAIEARVELGCAADFRDVFDVRGYRRVAARGEVSEEVGNARLRFTYQRGGFRRGTVVRVSGRGSNRKPNPDVSRSGSVSGWGRSAPRACR